MFSMYPLLTAQAAWQNDTVIITIKILFLKFKIDLLDKIASRINKKQKSKSPKQKDDVKRKDKKELSSQAVIEYLKLGKNSIGQLLRSFKNEEFTVKIDTGDYPLNAVLIPLTYYASLIGITLIINFNGENSARLKISNRLATILTIAIKTYFRFRKIGRTYHKGAYHG